MRPPAQLQEAIELTDVIRRAALEGGAAADTLAKRWFKERRYAGSSDRRVIRAHVWEVLRRFGEPPASARAAFVALADHDPQLAALFDGSERGPALIRADEPRETMTFAPDWLRARLDPRIDEAELLALTERAPVDVRIYRERLDVDLPEGGQPLRAPLDGMRFPPDTRVTESAAFARGGIEVQDAGSQFIAQLCAVEPGMCVIDLCAGAGGKTLALGAAMRGEGHIVACDTDRDRLRELGPRAERANLGDLISKRLLDPGRERAALSDAAGRADVVLVDAPCSGSGTWRRNPEARWRATPDRLARLTQLQARLLDIAAELVAPTGALIYAVCALTVEEGEGQVAAFSQRHPGWRAEDRLDAVVGRAAGAGRLLTPAHDGTDGFFMARLVRT